MWLHNTAYLAHTRRRSVMGHEPFTKIPKTIHDVSPGKFFALSKTKFGSPNSIKDISGIILCDGLLSFFFFFEWLTKNC